MKIVINTQYGGFGLSKENMQRYCDIKGIKCWIEDDNIYSGLGLFTVWTVPPEEREDLDDLSESQTLSDYNIARNDPALVQLVEENPGKFGRFSDLKVVEIPDDVEWTIEEYDGREWVAEVHRTWS